MIFCRTKFGKGILGRGMGFGNRLFPWARCRIYSHIHKITMANPIWVRPAFNQLWRGGVDYSCYVSKLILFRLFKTKLADLGTVQGIIKSIMAEKIDEPVDLNVNIFQKYNKQKNDVVIIFKGLANKFTPLNGWNNFLLDELHTITQNKYLDSINAIREDFISINVRCGNDFLEPKNDSERIVFHEKTPLNWYIESLEIIRDHIGYPIKAYVVSDGNEKQLKELLKLDN